MTPDQAAELINALKAINESLSAIAVIAGFAAGFFGPLFVWAMHKHN